MARALRFSPVLLAFALGAAPWGGVAAQTPKSVESSDNGRFSMVPAGDGFLKLDTRTGQTSLCRVEGGVARCQIAADERQAYETEIARLTKEVQAQKDGKSATDKSAKPGEDESWGPYAQRNLDRALDYAEKFIRRMMQIMREETNRS